jgi:hypothetical protein
MSGVREGAGRRMFGHPTNQRAPDASAGASGSAPATGRNNIYPSKGELTAQQVTALTKRAREDVAPLRTLDLGEHAFAEIEKTAERLAIERACGRLTMQQRQAWSKMVWADLRAHQRSDRGTRDLIDAVNARLWSELPAGGYERLQHSDAAYHPLVARHLVAWHERRTGQDASRERGKGYMAARHATIPQLVGATGTPSGRPSEGIADAS